MKLWDLTLSPANQKQREVAISVQILRLITGTFCYTFNQIIHKDLNIPYAGEDIKTNATSHHLKIQDHFSLFNLAKGRSKSYVYKLKCC